MRVLIIQDQLRTGGTERQSLLVADAIAKSGHESVLLLFRPGGELFTAMDTHPFTVHVLQAFDSRISLWAPGLTRKIRQIRPDILLCMGRTANCYAGYLRKRFPDVPVVATVRTGKRLLPFQAWSLQKANNIIVNASWWKRELVRRGIKREAIHLIHNACVLQPRPEQTPLMRADMRAGMKVEGTTCVFLNIANFRPGKRHKDLLEAFRKLERDHPRTDWQLWLVGTGSTIGECRRWCSRHGLDHKVRFLGYQSDPAPLYAAADAAVSLSMEDSLPNFLIEAQMMGLPVIARDCRGVRETFEPGKSGILVKTGSPAMLVPLLRQLATRPKLRESYSKTARKAASARFDPEQQNRRLIDLLVRINAKSN